MEQELKLNGKRIAIIATDGFEEAELTGPKDKLKNMGATVHVLSGKKQLITSWNKKNWGKEIAVDDQIKNVSAADYHALIIPGGVINADKLRRIEDAVKFIRDFDKQEKLIAAICHGPQLLIEAGIVNGKKMTSHRALKTDMKNAGANFIDEGVVEYDNYITAQGLGDITEFVGKIADYLKKH